MSAKVQLECRRDVGEFSCLLDLNAVFHNVPLFPGMKVDRPVSRLERRQALFNFYRGCPVLVWFVTHGVVVHYGQKGPVTMEPVNLQEIA